MEIETVNSIIQSIPKDIDYSSDNSDAFTRELCLAFVSHINIINILLSYCIQGAHHAYMNNQSVDSATLLRVIEKIVKTLQPLFKETTSSPI